VTLRSHLVTDRRRAGIAPSELVGRVRRAADRGLDVVQVRERDLCDRDLASLVRDVVAALSHTSTRILVNDRFDVAVVAAAHGVHLRADSVPASRIRAVAPTPFIIGRSVHTLADIDAAARDGGCDYLMFGTVFPSSGKPPGHPIAGIDALREACRRSPVPVIAIGGIDGQRLDEIARAGAAGFAAVRMFM
jgi:thiamine-phosphate pyrophosphorylase